MKDIIRKLRTLSGKQRLQIIRLLSTNKGLTVGDISMEINVPYKSTSKHLIRLADAGIVENERIPGNKIKYQLRLDPTGIVSAVIKAIGKRE